MRLHFHRAIRDVGGAYPIGTPTDPEAAGCRALFARVSPGPEDMGYPEYGPVTGEQIFFEIVGSIPGRRDAGRTFLENYDT